MAPASTPKIRHRNLHPSPTNHHPSSSLAIHTGGNGNNDENNNFHRDDSRSSFDTYNNKNNNNSNSNSNPNLLLSSPKIHGRRAQRREELLKSNKRMFLLGGSLAILALCLVGMWALNGIVDHNSNSNYSEREHDTTYSRAESNKKYYAKGKKRPEKIIDDAPISEKKGTTTTKTVEISNIHFSEFPSDDNIIKKQQLPPLEPPPPRPQESGDNNSNEQSSLRLHKMVGNIRENRKKLGDAHSPDESNEIMELYQTIPLETESKAEKTTPDDIDLDIISGKIRPRSEQEEKGHNDMELDDDAVSNEGSEKPPVKLLNRSNGERPSAAVPLPKSAVDMKRWGYNSRPRVLNCIFERAPPNENSSENSEDPVIDDLYDTSLVLSSVTRLPDHETEPLLASKRHVTPYPDDQDYIDRVKDVHKNSKKYRNYVREPLEDSTCIARHEWQKGAFPNCNMMHEFELGSLAGMYGRMLRDGLNPREGEGDEQVRYWAHGFWRDVWLVSKALGGIPAKEEEIVVLKTLRYTHDFSDRNYDRHRRDALASMRLSRSPNIVDIFGYCANSAIFEYGPGGDVDEKLFPWDSKAKKYYVAELSSWEKIDIAYQVARAIADVHDVEEDGIASIAHTDIAPSQFIYIDGRYKLNDFNRCRFMRIDETDQTPCGFYVGANPGKFRAPEEYAYEEEDERIDIYSMGNIFYAIIAEDMPYENLKEKVAQKKVRDGERPRIPDDVLKSEDVAIQAILSAMKRCWAQKPADRPKAAVIRDELKDVMDRIRMENETKNNDV